MNPAWTLCALLALPSISARAAAQRGEDAYFATADEIALHAHGWSFDYRFRRVEMRPDGDGEGARMIWDGVARLRYEADGIWSDELYVELLDAEGHRSTPRRTRSYHSLSSGLYARAFALAGGPTQTAIVERWSGLPMIAFFALGLVDGESTLRRASFAGREQLAAGRERVDFVSPEGKLWRLEHSTSGAGALVSISSRTPGSAWVDWIVFEGHVDGPEGLPQRPTRITSARVGDSGQVAHLSIWQAIERRDAPQPSDFTLPPRTTIADFRIERAGDAPSSTDRALELDELLTWSGALGTPHSAPPTTLQREDLERQIEASQRSGGRTRVGWAMAFVGVVLGAVVCLRRNRT